MRAVPGEGRRWIAAEPEIGSRAIPALAGLVALLLSAAFATPASAQVAAGEAGVLEQWTVGYLAEGWAPRWTPSAWPAAPGPFLMEQQDGSPRLSVETMVETLVVNSALDQRAAMLNVSVRQRLAGPLGLHLAASSSAWRTRAEGDVLLETPRSESVAAGPELAGTIAGLGEVGALALAGYDGAPGGLGRIYTRGRHHGLSVTGWTTTARQSRIVLSPDSLWDVGTSPHARGLQASAAASLPVWGLTLTPSFAWRRELLDQRETASETYMAATPQGSTTRTRIGLGVGGSRTGISLLREERALELEARLVRSEQSAGNVPLTRYGAEGWRAELWRRSASREWRISAATETISGEVAARVETWPFIGLWESTVAHAYRFNGQVDGQVSGIGVSSEPLGAARWGWAVHADRYTARFEKESWLVTSFGFGREEQEKDSGGAEALYIAGLRLERSLPLAGGRLAVRVAAGFPVYARLVDGESGDGRDEDDRRESDSIHADGWVVGFGGVSLSWFRR